MTDGINHANEILDEFIQYTQRIATKNKDYLVWIDYDKLKDVVYLARGGFSKVYKAIWIDGPHFWNEGKENFEYNDPNIVIALKQLNYSKNITFKQLKEVSILFIFIIVFF